MTKMTIIPENYNNIRAEIVARFASVAPCFFIADLLLN